MYREVPQTTSSYSDSQGGLTRHSTESYSFMTVVHYSENTEKNQNEEAQWGKSGENQEQVFRALSQWYTGRP